MIGRWNLFLSAADKKRDDYCGYSVPDASKKHFTDTNTPILQSLDMSSLRYIANNSNKMILSSTVFTPAQREFISAAIPKIEVHRPSLGLPLLADEDPSIIAVACDEPIDCSSPQLTLQNTAEICQYIKQWIQKNHD